MVKRHGTDKLKKKKGNGGLQKLKKTKSDRDRHTEETAYSYKKNPKSINQKSPYKQTNQTNPNKLPHLHTPPQKLL